MKLAPWISALVLATTLTAFAYDSVEELLNDQQKEQIKALRTYVKDHPDAADITDAQDRLAYGLVMMNEYDEAIAMLVKKYEAMIKDMGETPMEQFFGTTVVPIIQTYVQAGQIKEGKDFLARVRKDLGEKAAAPDVTAALDQLGEGLKLPEVGQAVDIKFTAVDGTEIDVSKMTEKVVLVDYWATWCMPCMQELPRVKEIYKKYHDKGFEIVGISLDEDKEALEKTIKTRDITWAQSYDGEGWDSKLASKYGVQSIPTTFLLAKDGKVAALNLRGEALDKKVAELLAADDPTK